MVYEQQIKKVKKALALFIALDKYSGQKITSTNEKPFGNGSENVINRID